MPKVMNPVYKRNVISIFEPIALPWFKLIFGLVKAIHALLTHNTYCVWLVYDMLHRDNTAIKIYSK